MFDSLPRRQRRLALTATFAGLFLGLAGIVAFFALKPRASYQPGQKVEGLTSDLSRTLPSDYPRVTFVDVTREAGITYRNFSGTRTSQLPEDMGSGAAWGDFDDDGWEDLAIANEVGPLSMTDAERRASPARVVLYHNNHDGTFTDVTDQSGITFRGWGMAVAWGDYDNDGRIDLLITAYGHNVLYHNDGGHFSDRSATTGIGRAEGFWTAAAWGDYDRDGFLDLYVTGYVKYTKEPIARAPGVVEVENPASINPASFTAERKLLFHNNRDGTFTERAAAAGVDNPAGRGLAASWVDLDGDGWPDLYVGNDVSDNVLYRNRHDGTFEDISHASRVADYRSSMGIAVGDWNGDGRLDLFLTHWLAQGNALYDNVPLGPRTAKSPPVIFVDESDRYGLGQISLDFIGWGTSFIDYDLDGKLDLFVVNGSTLQRREAPTQLVPMRSQLFWNRGPTEGFFETSAVSGDFFKGSWVGRGAAFADFDNDGDVDAIVTTNGGAAHLLRNDGGNRNHWLQIQLRGTKSNSQGIGARVRLVAGGVSQVRQVGAQASYLSQNSLIETFGLGSTQRADTLEIVWPSGGRQVLTNVAGGQRIRIVEGRDAVQAAADSELSRQAVREFWSRYRAAMTARVEGRIGEARDAYRKALELNPRHEDVLYYLGNMELELGDFGAAEIAWRRLVDINPGSARTHSRLGDLYACPDSGAPWKLARAQAEYARAAELNREETGPLLRLGEVAVLRGDLTSAVKQFDAVIVTHPRSVEAHYLKGYVAWKRGQSAAAATELQNAVALASAPQPVQQAPSEGDTKQGTTPLVVRRVRCRLFDDDLNYSRLDRRLQQIASLHQ